MMELLPSSCFWEFCHPWTGLRGLVLWTTRAWLPSWCRRGWWRRVGRGTPAWRAARSTPGTWSAALATSLSQSRCCSTSRCRMASVHHGQDQEPGHKTMIRKYKIIWGKYIFCTCSNVWAAPIGRAKILAIIQIHNIKTLAVLLLCFFARGYIIAWYLSIQMATRVQTDAFT